MALLSPSRRREGNPDAADPASAQSVRFARLNRSANVSGQTRLPSHRRRVERGNHHHGCLRVEIVAHTPSAHRVMQPAYRPRQFGVRHPAHARATGPARRPANAEDSATSGYDNHGLLCPTYPLDMNDELRRYVLDTLALDMPDAGHLRASELAVALILGHRYVACHPLERRRQLRAAWMTSPLLSRAETRGPAPRARCPRPRRRAGRLRCAAPTSRCAMSRCGAACPCSCALPRARPRLTGGSKVRNTPRQKYGMRRRKDLRRWFLGEEPVTTRQGAPRPQRNLPWPRAPAGQAVSHQRRRNLAGSRLHRPHPTPGLSEAQCRFSATTAAR